MVTFPISNGMKINTKSTSITLTPDITNYLDKKLEGLKKFIDPQDPAVMIDVELGKTTRHHQTGDIFRAEINIFAPQKTFRAEAESSDLYSAIDELKDQIQNELRSDKKKTLHFVRKSGQKLKNFLRGFTGPS